MSTLSGINAAAGAGYATQLASSAALKRSLSNLENAINNGALDAAGTILTQIMNANPQYAQTGASSPSSASSTASQDPINQGFEDVSRAISANQVDAARSAWAQLKNYLTQKGITNLNDGSGAISKLVAESKASVDQAVLSNAFSPSAADSGNSLLSLLEPSATATSHVSESVGALVSNWLTYQSGGMAASTPPNPTISVLNSIA